jgi:hypothetical protein
VILFGVEIISRLNYLYSLEVRDEICSPVLAMYPMLEGMRYKTQHVGTIVLDSLSLYKGSCSNRGLYAHR